MNQNDFQHSCLKRGIGSKDLLVKLIRSQCGKLQWQFPALPWVMVRLCLMTRTRCCTRGAGTGTKAVSGTGFKYENSSKAQIFLQNWIYVYLTWVILKSW